MWLTRGWASSASAIWCTGETDSERIFALITAYIRRHDGDVGAGIADAVGWLAETVPIFAVNMLAEHRDGHVGAALPGDPRAVSA